MIYFIYSFLTIILIIITYKNYIMSNQVVTIGYLKTFVNGVISVNTTKSDSYCPTYAELTGGTLVQNYSAGTNPTNHKPGIKIPSCTVGIGYTNNQLVIRQDLQLLWYVLQSVDVSASPTTISCCGGSSTLSTTAYFNLSTKKENGITSASTNTSTVITASYSDDKSYTTISGNKITFSKNSVNYPSSTSAAARSTTVTSTYEYSGVTKTDTVSITQNSNSVGSWTWISDTTTSISVSPASMSFESGGGSKSYSVTRYYTSYYERYDSCNTLMDTDTDSNSTSVTPTSYNCTGGFTCTSSKVSCDTNTGSSRTGTLTVTWGGFSDTCSLSQGASQAGTSYGDPYNYDYYLSVSTPSGKISCDGGSATFTARYVTTWDYDWVTKNDAGEVTNSGTSSDSSSTNVTNSAEWSTTVGSVSKGTLTLGAYDEDTRRTATVTAKYNGYSDSDYVYQESCAPDTPITPPATPCMTIFYTISNGAAATVYFKTTNGTQQGSHEVDAQGSQQLCNIAEGTDLVVSCNNGDVTVGGDTSFTFYSGTTASISLTKSGGGGSTCTAKTNYTGLTLSSYTFEACDTSPSLTVKANGIRTYSDCSTATTSTTLSSSNYTTSYDKTPSVNQNSSNQTYRVTITGKGTYAGLSNSVNIVQNAGPCNTGSTASTCMNIEYSVPVTLSSSVIVSFKDSSGAIIAAHTVPSTTGTTTKEICGLTNGKALTASCSDDTVTMSGGINFNFSAGTTEYITVQAPNSRPTGSTVTSTTYTYRIDAADFDACDSETTVTVYATPTYHYSDGSNTKGEETEISVFPLPTITYRLGTGETTVTASENSTSSSRIWTVLASFKHNNSTHTASDTATQSAGPCNTGSTVYEYTFKNCYSDRQISLFASNATPSGSHLQFAMLSALDGTATTVLVTSNNGTMVNGSSSNSSSYAKIGDSVKVYSVTNTTNIWTLEETITLTASNRSFEYGCSSIPTSCTCSTVSISCNPTNSYTTGNSVSTVVTVNAGSNCSTKWKAYSSSGSYLGEGESGKSLSRTTTGTVTFRSDACSGKTTTWTISKPECAKPTIRLSGSGDAYMLQSYSETDEWCGTNPNVSVSTSADYIGDGSDNTHYSPTTCSFEIANCAASITSINLDSGGWILDSHSGLNSFGISFTIRPDAIVNATCILSGSFTYLMQGTPFSGTFSISIQFNG